MGLDVVEVVMRCEEVFGVSLPDAKLSLAETVGALYRVICEELKVNPLSSPDSVTGRLRRRSQSFTLEVYEWTPEDIWTTLVWIVMEQLQVEQAEVRYDAHWRDDLGAD